MRSLIIKFFEWKHLLTHTIAIYRDVFDVLCDLL